MTHLKKLLLSSFLQWGSFRVPQNHHKSSKPPFFWAFFQAKGNPRFYSRRRAPKSDNCQTFAESSALDAGICSQFSISARTGAQEAVLEYLHCTRCLPFLDAEYMSKNSPYFLENLLENVETGSEDSDIGHSITRFLRYHPINEFEPFFESLGLKPSEFAPILPRNLMFLTDDNIIIENCSVLYNYGIARNKIGRIYMEASEVFRYDFGVLESQLQALNGLGLCQSSVCKAVSCSPSILTARGRSMFIKVLEEVKSLGIECSWIVRHLSDEDSYNWMRIHGLLCLFSRSGCDKKQLGTLISQHPEFLLHSSGSVTYSIVVYLLKFGCTIDGIVPILLQFPQVKVVKFLQNMRHCYHFLLDIEMESAEIGRIFRSNPLAIGSCTLKKTNTLFVKLNSGKKRIRKTVKENPEVLRKWVLGSRVERLSDSSEALRSKKHKLQFLLELGFIEDSEELKRALKMCRGKGGELQERFNCFLQSGMDREDASELIRRAPQILNQSKAVIEQKIDYIVNGLGFSITSLLTFPAYMCATIQGVKLRFMMYYWLQQQGLAKPNLSLSTIVSGSEKYFVNQYVNRHPRGPEVWADMKKCIFAE